MFGPTRCMFESNFPVDKMAIGYKALWNAFKRIASGASRDEKLALFSGTAARTYRLESHSGECPRRFGFFRLQTGPALPT